MPERVMALEVTTARHGERIESVEEYQQKQNGSIQRVEEKMDGLNAKLIALLGGIVASLILLIVNISIGR